MGHSMGGGATLYAGAKLTRSGRKLPYVQSKVLLDHQLLQPLPYTFQVQVILWIQAGVLTETVVV